MPQREARAEAIRRAKASLRDALARSGEDPAALCARLGLPEPGSGSCELDLFGRVARFYFPSLSLEYAEGGEPPQADQILLLRCLSYPGTLRPGGELVSFRSFSGGAFYWEPFRSRSSAPLLARYGSDPGALRRALDRFTWTELPLGDFAARILGLGPLYLTLVYDAPEEGFPAEINVLFENAAVHAFGAEDAAAFASRICLGLL